MWLTFAKLALNVAIAMIAQVPNSQWALLGTAITTWLQKLEANLPPGNPLITHLNAWRVQDRAKLQAPKPEPEKWDS